MTNLLANRAVYAGTEHTPAILDPALAQRAASARTKRDRRTKAAYALRGLVSCGSCGNKMEVDRYNRSQDDAEKPRFVKYRCRKGGHPVVAFRQQDYLHHISTWLLSNLPVQRLLAVVGSAEAATTGAEQETALEVLRGVKTGEWRPAELRAAYLAIGVRFVYERTDGALVINGIGQRYD